MKIKTVDDAINVIIETSIIHAEASFDGNYKIANKNFDKREKALEFLKAGNNFYQLVPLLNNENDAVRLYSAQNLIKTEEPQSVKVLEDLEKKTGFVSLIAKYFNGT